MATTQKQITSLVNTDTLFQSLVNPYIVFGIDDPHFTILEENEAHAVVAMVNRRDVVGRPLFDVFPDTSEEYVKTGKSPLLESIRKVIRTGKSDTMPLLSYDLKDQSGKMKKMYWTVVHHPVKGKDGKIVAVYQDTHDITNEVAIGNKLKSAENRLNQVLASSLIGTYSWEINQDIVYADQNLASMFGIDPKIASTGLPIEDFIHSIHQDDRGRVEASIQKTLKTRKPFEEEYRTLDATNKVHWVIVRGFVEVDENDQPTNFSGVIVDITDRKNIERDLLDSENRVRFLADSIPQLAWIGRPDGYREYFNNQWYEFTGTTLSQSEGEGWRNLVYPADLKRVTSAWKNSVKSGDIYEVEYRLYHAPTQTYRWVIGRSLPYYNDEGTIKKWYGTSTDIDEQKRTSQIQSFLSNASKELASSLDSTSTLKKITELCVPTVADWCTVDLYDPEKGFEQVSVAHVDPRKISVAKNFRKHNPLHIDNPDGVPKVIRTGETVYYPRITIDMYEPIKKDKKMYEFMKSLNLHSFIIAPIRLNETVIGGISFVSSDSGRYYTDADLHMAEELAARISLAITNSKLYEDSISEITQRRKLEQALIQEKQKLESRVKERTKQLQLTNEGLREEISKRRIVEDNLERSNSELEDFAYVASHDLQEPLRKIQAFSNLLKTEYAEELGDGSDYVDRMDAAASRMSTLIQDLLAFSRVATKMNPKTHIRLNEIVADVLTDLETSIKETGGEVKVDDLPDVIADPTHMRQLFQNLIGNALKFHIPNEKPLVKVTSDLSNKKFITICVSDNGIGFDQKYLDRIFSVFQRLHGRDRYEGTGIGLAVCRKIVERYGGTITAESEINKGATFIVRLPRIKEKVA